LLEVEIHPVWLYNKLTVSNKYHRFCAEDPKVIGNMKQAGMRQIEIAQAIGLCQSVISKELSRNRGERGYRPLRLSVSRRSARAGEGRARP
jgi:IS30 family transposase